MKRRFMTLLETLIALGMAMMILSTLTFFYRQIVVVNDKVEKMQEESFRMRYVENRLAAILPKAVSEKDEKKDFFFFTTSSILSFATGPTLFFTYDNGIKLDKLFSNHVLGRLYLDQEGQFTLATWPSPHLWVEGISPPMKRELLLEGVRELQLEFFVAPDRDWEFGKAPTSPKEAETPVSKTGSKPVVKPTPEGEWIPNWSYDYQQLPAMVKVHLLLKNGGERQFIFPLPKTQRQIVYKS